MTNPIQNKMDINNIFNKTLDFLIKRIVELFAIFVIISSILLLISLSSYSPDDPNFIFPENTQIKNILGIQGSFISDLFYQSFGLISLIIPVTFFFTGINIFRSKKILLFIENIFFIILYCISGTLFFSIFYKTSFWLPINGNGGFVGNFLESTFLLKIVNLNNQIFYYLIIFLTFILFLISINFKLKLFLKFLGVLFNKLKNNKIKENNIESELSENLISEEKIDDIRVQENLPFSSIVKTDKKVNNRFKLPHLDFLKKPIKKERENKSDQKIDEKSLETNLNQLLA